MADEIIFNVSNRHSAKMGTPPQIDGDVQNRYYGYFENELKEQALFVFDYETRTGTLWMGDAGWDKSFRVVDGKVPELVTSINESLWLRLCWETAVSVLPK